MGKVEPCPMCSSTNVAVARSMRSTRHCGSCGYVWDPVKNADTIQKACKTLAYGESGGSFIDDVNKLLDSKYHHEPLRSQQARAVGEIAEVWISRFREDVEKQISELWSAIKGGRGA